MTAVSATIPFGLCKFNIKFPSSLHLFIKKPAFAYGFLFQLKLIFTFAAVKHVLETFYGMSTFSVNIILVGVVILSSS